MTVQYSTTVRNAKLDAVETAIGTSAIMKIRTGSVPANCAAADSGTVVATLNLPSDWMANASGAVKGLSGVWQDSSADATGTAAHFRIYDSGGSTCHIQGTVSTSGADLIVDNTSFNAGQAFSVTAFNLTAGNP